MKEFINYRNVLNIQKTIGFFDILMIEISKMNHKKKRLKEMKSFLLKINKF
ncbi:unnamed protein product, partial [Schistosoma curassoni]|uniref:Uncharacterized protein n=1 Tax=Schistosoma curassoni TaxID=6186 RepID=A0A183KJ52_9TREM